jgi:hypothetical protein
LKVLTNELVAAELGRRRSTINQSEKKKEMTG